MKGFRFRFFMCFFLSRVSSPSHPERQKKKALYLQQQLPRTDTHEMQTNRSHNIQSDYILYMYDYRKTRILKDVRFFFFFSLA